MAHKIEALIHQIDEVTSSLYQLEIEPKQLAALAASAEALMITAKTPTDRIMDTLVNIASITAMRLFIDWKVFENIPLNRTISYTELAGKVEAEPSIIARLAGMLVSTSYLRQDENGQVGYTEESKLLTHLTTFTALVKLGFDMHIKSFACFPEYFAKYGCKEPTGRYHTISAYASGDAELTVWEHVSKSPEKMQTFMISMVAMSHKYPIMGTYDFSWVAGEAKKSDRTVLVHVGGGRGHAVKEICEATSGIDFSRCVVEDLQKVVDEARSSAEGGMRDVKFVAMDFHTEQPIKDAHIYYIRRCLHDYGDNEAVEILKQLHSAMASDSRLLIVGEVLTNPPTPLAAATDLAMATLGGKERSLDNFKLITSQANSKITQVATGNLTGVAVIECMRA